MATVIKRPTSITTEVQVRPGSVLAITAAFIAVAGSTIGLWEGWRALRLEQENIRLERENVDLREVTATLKGRLEQVDGLLGLVGMHKIEAGKGGPR